MGAPAAMTEMPWIRWLDLDTSFDAGGVVRAVLARPKPEHLNHNAAVNAAVAYGVAEVAGAGAAVASVLDLLDRVYTVVGSGSINYTAPARGGLVAVGHVEPAVGAAARAAVEGGTEAVIDVVVQLTDLDDRPTGTCTFAVVLRPRR